MSDTSSDAAMKHEEGTIYYIEAQHIIHHNGESYHVPSATLWKACGCVVKGFPRLREDDVGDMITEHSFSHTECHWFARCDDHKGV